MSSSRRSHLVLNEEPPSSPAPRPPTRASRVITFVERVWNHLVMLAALAILLPQFLAGGSECPVISVHNLLLDQVHEPTDKLDLEAGIAYSLPPGVHFVLGGGLTLLGLMMLVFGLKMQQIISAAVVVASLALVAEEVSVRTLLLRPLANRYAVNLTLSRGAVSVGSVVVDLACSGSLFAVLLAISAGVHFVALQSFKRTAQFFEGAVSAVLAVRLASQFVPWLLESHPIAGAGYDGHFFLGYPVVPFWAIAMPLAFLVGAIEPVPCMQALITCFLGAFAATKGMRTVQEYLAGYDDIELAGGNDVHSDPLQGLIQLGLFVVGLLIHQRLWLRSDDGGGGGCLGGACASYDCCPCCSDEAERAEEAAAQQRAQEQRRGSTKRTSMI